MPRAARYKPIPLQMVRLARQARREGMSFDVFWAERVFARPLSLVRCPREHCVVWPSDADVRHSEQEIIRATESAWRSAWYRRPARRRELALRYLDLNGLLTPAPRATWKAKPSGAARYTHDDALAALRAFHAEHGGRWPDLVEWRMGGYRPSVRTMVRRFGSWQMALAAAAEADRLTAA